VDSKKIPRDKSIKRDDHLLFSESNTRFVVEVARGKEKAFEARFKGLPCAKAGKVENGKKLVIKGLKGNTVIDASIASLKKAWKQPLAF
jgi:phosphoribosylformylglycinamidine synthase subunit PurSL